MTPLISLQHVTRDFRLDESTVITPLAGVDLDIERGEFLMIVGRSGSGKTTLLNLCAGLINPTAGRVLVDGKDILTLDDGRLSAIRREKFGFIFQFQSMLPNLTVLENVCVPAFESRNGDAGRTERAVELLRTVGLGQRMQAFPRQLSAGELRRVAIARALVNGPQLVLADEPTADLDTRTELEIVSLLRRIHAAGVTIVMITHNMGLVPYATRAVTVQDGRLTPVPPVRSAAGYDLAASITPSVEPLAPLSPAAVPGTPATARDAISSLISGTRVRPRILKFGGALLGGCAMLVVGGLLLARTSHPATGKTGLEAAIPLRGISALRQYDRISATFAGMMAFEYPGGVFDFPVNLAIPRVTLTWTGTAFSGMREDTLGDATSVYSVSGTASDNGELITELVFSSRTVSSSQSYSFKVKAQNVAITDVWATSGGTGSSNQSGSSLKDNIVEIEYLDTQNRESRSFPPADSQSVRWESTQVKPSLSLSFWISREAPPEPPPPGPSRGGGM